MGGGAAFFDLQPDKAFLIDLNQDLIAAYQCVRDNPSELIACLLNHQRSHLADPKLYYYQCRETYNKFGRRSLDLLENYGCNTKLSFVERAALFIYLNKTCFNGLHRTNKKGEFNAPMGNYKSPSICNPEAIYAASAALQKATILHATFNLVATNAIEGDFVYFDPPYHPLTETSNFTGYTQEGFNAAQQVRLRDLCLELRSRGVKVAVSNSDCEFIRNLYQDFSLHQIWASRAINCKAGDRGKISELLITSY